MRVHLSALVACAMAAASCCATTSLAPAGTQVLRAETERSRELVLPSAHGGAIRVGPSSWIRFVLVSGAVSPWFEAKRLRLTRDLVVGTWARVHYQSSDAPTILPWDQIATTEVNDYDLTTTLKGAAIGIPTVMLAAMVEFALMSAIAGLTGGLLKPDELGITRAAMEFVTSEIGKRPPDATPAKPAVPSEPSTAAVPAPDPEAEAARLLFSGAATRRDTVRLSMASDVGMETGGPARATVGVLAVVRIKNGFEVGGGLRLFSTALAGGPDGTAPAVKAMLVLRLGWHVDVDARRRLALPLLFEGGGGSGSTGYARLIWGLRIRLGNRAQLGLYPWNPMVFPQADHPGGSAAPPRRSSGYVSTVDLAWII